MKKLCSIMLVCVLLVGLFTACSKDTKKEKTGSSDTASSSEQKPEKSDKKVLAVIALHTLSNPYQVQLKEGAEMFVKSLGDKAELQVTTCEGSDEKEINNIKAAIARGGKDTIVFIDPNQAPNAAAVAEICEEAGVYWTSCWSTAEGVYPMNNEHYVMFQSPDDAKSGYDIAVELFKSFDNPGKGKMLAIQGALANSAAINRFKGLNKALSEFPDIELLDQQAGDWNPQKALTITETWLSKYQDVDGIWVANDSMALAVVQALKAKGLDKKVKVVGIDAIDGAIEAIQAGDMVATVASNGWMQAGYGLSYAYAAYAGDIDPKTMPQEKTMIHTAGQLITGDTVEDYVKNFIDNKPEYDFTDLESIIYRPMDAPEGY